MNDISFKMTRGQAKMIFSLIRSDVAAHKNWIMSAVETGDTERAQELTRTTRRLETLARAFNVEVKDMVAQERGRELATEIDVND
jgi:hypothetical protein